ncbi:MAG: ATP-binding protein [Bacteroidales bacterium]|nr:ATP-binding protein [Bacteroidales bacterium]
MEQTTERKYPVGIQTFSEIRKGNYIYIDKTDLVWQMTKNKYVFLSRPRRFGKSLLTTTLDSYFKGDKELFDGLKIMELEKEWKQYPVLHFDLSGARHLPVEQVKDELNRQLDDLETVYGSNPAETSPGMRLAGLIKRSSQQTGAQAAVIIDEYDAPLLDVLHDTERLEAVREVMQEFYQRLKMCEAMIRFCFITGITKFSQLSIFSTINNLTNISMDDRYAAICGITEQELATDMAPDIAMLAKEYECTPEEMHEKLKQMYDGYRFAKSSPDIYNPFSLLKCFNHKDISNYWFDSGTPTFLIRQMRHFRTDITTMERIEASSSAFDRPTEAMTTALPLLYQSGYLTIKDYEKEGNSYVLAIPNKEVRTGLTEGLIPTYTGLDSSAVQDGFAIKFWRALKREDIDTAMEEMKAFLAGIPYVEGFQKKLEEVKNYEGFYEYTFYLIFNMMNVYARTQVKCKNGRIDFVVLMPETTWVFELKVNGTAQEALEQINSKGYAIPYQTEGRRVIKVGVQFARDTMTVGEWVVE